MTVQVPDYLKTGPHAEAAARALQDATSMAASSNSVPRVSLRGREFRIIDNGEEIKKYRDHMDFVIMGVEPEAGLMIKTFYAKGYQPGAKEPPTCSSDDGIAPSPWVTEKQSPTCKTCPKNLFGSATSPTGKATKACRDGKRIWIALADDPKPLTERTLYGLNVTVASLKSFSDLGRTLAGVGQAPCVAVTRATMADTEFPQLEFSVQGWLPAEDVPLSLEISRARPWKMFGGAATLALAGGAETTRQIGNLPSQLPAGMPSTPTAAPAGQTVVDATPAGAKSVDDEIAKW